MSKFEDACLLSCEEWVNSFPADIPEHKFSKNHQQKMKAIFRSEQKGSKKLSNKKIKLLLIAAILLLTGTITVSANQTCREYIITKFFDHSEYIVEDIKKVKSVDSLNLNYIPSGFEKNQDYGYSIDYKKGNEFFVVDKNTISTTIYYNTEKYENEVIKINGADAIYYWGGDNYNGIIFNNLEYIYSICGNIEKEELIKIAQNIE